MTLVRSIFRCLTTIILNIIILKELCASPIFPNISVRNSEVRRALRSRPSILLYKLYFPFRVTATTISSGEEDTETVIEFRPDIQKLKNITRAYLNFTLPQIPAGSDTSGPLVLIGGHSSLSEEIRMTDKEIEPVPNTGHFNVLPFLRNVTTERLPNQETGALIVRIVFKLKRHCLRTCEHLRFLRQPLLKVDCTRDIDHSGDREVTEMFATRLTMG